MSDPVNINAEWKRIERTSKKTGIVKRGGYRIEVRADDLIVDADAREANAVFGEGLARLISDQITNIMAPAAHSTVKKREASSRNRTSRSYRKRYAGGRTGETPPTGSRRLFNDSGRMARGVHVQPRRNSVGESVATINVPANRLDPITFGSTIAFERMRMRLTEFVPILAGRADNITEIRVRRLIEELTEGMISTNERRHRQLLAQRNAAVLQLVRAASGFF